MSIINDAEGPIDRASTPDRATDVLELAQPTQKTAPCDHVMNTLREGKGSGNVRDRLLEELPVRLVLARSPVGRRHRRNHETVDEGGVKIIDLDHLAECRKCVVVADVHVEIVEGRERWLSPVALRRRQPTPHQVQLHGLRKGIWTIDDLQWPGVWSRQPSIPECGVVGRPAPVVETVKPPTCLKVRLIFSQAPDKISHSVAASRMACNDELVDLKLRRRLQIGKLEARNSRKYFFQVVFAPVRFRQVLNAVVSSKLIFDGIFETQERCDKHHILVGIANLFTYPRRIVAEQKFMVSDKESMQPDHDVEHVARRSGFRRKIDGRRLDAVRGPFREQRHARKDAFIFLLQLTPHAGCSASPCHARGSDRLMLGTAASTPQRVHLYCYQIGTPDVSCEYFM